MAFRTWGRLLLTALGVSVLAGAGQLGIAYGFGVVRLDAAFTEGSVNRWPAQLAWVGWFAAVAAVTGAVVTGRLARRDAACGGTPEQLAVAGAAALGATVVAPLCMQPARAAELGGTVDPVWAVGICAILGAVVGAGVAIAALLRPPFGWNIALTVTVVWLLALVSVAPSVASAGTPPTVRLGVLEPSWLDPAVAQRLAVLILPTVSLLTGAAVGALARRRGHPPLVGGAAGATGPVLLTFAYLAAGPGDPTDRYQLAPYYGALIAVAAGALGSTATTLLRRPGTGTTAEGTAVVPTDILQPLPASPAVLAARTADPADGGPARTDGVDPAAAVVPGRSGPRTPAHWDWPVPAGVRPASVPAQATRPALDSTTAGPRDEPVTDERTGDEPVTERPDDAPTAGERTGDEPVADRRPDDEVAGPGDEVAGGREGLTRHLPVPGLLPTGRRTSAIDVLAAGPPSRPGAPTPGPEPIGSPPPAAPDVAGDSPLAAPADPADTTSDGSTVAGAVPAPADARATIAETTPTPAAGPATTGPPPADARATRRPKRGRGARTGRATDVPAGGDVPTPPVPTGDGDRAAPAVGGTTPPRDEPADSGASGDGRRATSRFFPVDGDQPAEQPRPVDGATSPRPRIPIFEDETDQPRRVRPAWPLAPAPSWPITPRAADPAGTTGPSDTADPTSSTADPGGATDRSGPANTPANGGRREPAPRPRHRALPDLGRGAGWDPFASARPGTPQHTGPTVPIASPDTGPATPQQATPRAPEPGGPMSRLRRGLFRRNRARDAEVVEAEHEPEPLAEQDEEFVDWVAGLAPDTDAKEPEAPRTGRHHRD